ncbi:hypothetical protein WICPIJ_001294 [Wickerhamomyces pijperi]|uniref:Protein AHC1 n=1 Tax=Wickerhamomyces pijperi TaxID=599730 RepID=A0A9P8TQV3_WICPI|nr:hypothetical protein WICPIJ_001294 [Wickerhamomyces pijperi]
MPAHSHHIESGPTVESDAQSNKGVPHSIANYLQVATPKSPNTDAVFEEAMTPTLPSDKTANIDDKKARQNLLDEIDIEILLKHREYNLILNEIENVKNNMTILKNLHDDPNYANFINRLLELQEQELTPVPGYGIKNSYSSYGSAPSSSYSSQAASSAGVEFGPYSLRRSSNRSDDPPRVHRTSYGGIHPILDSNGNKICVHRRSDGVIVKVECGACGRTDFGSAQGFLNHSRLSHQIEFKSQDHAALECGEVLDEIEQDQLGTESLQKLRAAGLDVNRNLAPGFALVETESANRKKRKTSKSGKTPPSLSKPNNNQPDLSTGASTQSPLPQNVPDKVLPPSSHLANLYASSKLAGDPSDFETLLEEVSTQVLIDEDDCDTSPSPADSTNPPSSAGASQPTKPSLVKGHNRRKSRGGLSSVKFEDDFLTTERNFTLQSANDSIDLHYRTPSTDSVVVDPIERSGVFAHHNNPDPHHHLTGTINPSHLLQRLQQDDSDDGDVDFDMDGNSHVMMHLMTPAQKRRIPSVPNPLRTRSRTNKD